MSWELRIAGVGLAVAGISLIIGFLHAWHGAPSRRHRAKYVELMRFRGNEEAREAYERRLSTRNLAPIRNVRIKESG